MRNQLILYFIFLSTFYSLAQQPKKVFTRPRYCAGISSFQPIDHKDFFPAVVREGSQFVYRQASYEGQLYFPKHFSASFLYQNFRHKATYEKQEYTGSGLLGPYYLGDQFTVEQHIRGFQLQAGYAFLPYRDVHQVGYSVTALLGLGYWNIVQTENAEFAGNYRNENTSWFGTVFKYDTSTESRKFHSGAIIFSTGLRGELYLTRYFSFIFPELKVNTGIIKADFPSHRYYSTIDSESIYVERTRVPGFFLLFSAGALIRI